MYMKNEKKNKKEEKPRQGRLTTKAASTLLSVGMTTNPAQLFLLLKLISTCPSFSPPPKSILCYIASQSQFHFFTTTF